MIFLLKHSYCADDNEDPFDLDIGMNMDVNGNEDVIMDVDMDVDMDVSIDMDIDMDTEGQKDHNYAKQNTFQPDLLTTLPPITKVTKLRLDPEPHQDAVSPIQQKGIQIDDQLRQGIINVHLYLSKISSNPLMATAAAFKLHRQTIAKIITSSADPLDVTPVVPVTAPEEILVTYQTPSRATLPVISHPDAKAPVQTGGVMDSQFRQTVINVKLYLATIASNPVTATAAACKLDRHTVSKIIREGPKPAKHRRTRKKLVELDDMDKANIVNIVHGFFRRKEYPTVKTMLAKVKEELKERFPYGETTLRRILHELGFRYGRRQSKNLHFLERSDIALWRIRYLREIREQRQKKRDIIYLDETWFNCNEVPKHIWHDTRVEENPRLAQHPNSERTLGLPEASSRGKRLIVVGAINETGIIPNSVLIFPSKSPITPEDYHKDMDAHNFEKWFQERLLPNINPNSVIVMDNAPYHSRKVHNIASNLRRAEILTRLIGMGFFTYIENLKKSKVQLQGGNGDMVTTTAAPEKLTKRRLLDLWKLHKKAFEKFVVDEIAAAHGHTVVRLPPYHCHLNPIELLWAYQKSLARKEGGVDRSVSKAMQTCEQAFNAIPGDDLEPYFRHTLAEEEKYWKRGYDEAFKKVPPVIIPMYDSSSSEASEEV